MAFVKVDPVKLKELDDATRNKENKELEFLESPAGVIDRFVKKTVAPKKPFEIGQGFPYTYKPGGNFLHRPLIDVPFINFGTSWFTMQGPFRPKFCQIMERDFMRCVSRVGLQNTDKVCRIYWEDLLECQTHDKSRKRTAFMRKVRAQKKVEPVTDIPYTAFPQKSCS